MGIYRWKLQIQFTAQELVCVNAAQCSDCNSLRGDLHTHTLAKIVIARQQGLGGIGNPAAHATRNKSGLEQLWRLFNK